MWRGLQSKELVFYRGEQELGNAQAPQIEAVMQICLICTCFDQKLMGINALA